MTTDPVRAGITEKRTFLRSAEKCFFWPKMGFNQKNHPKFLKRLIFIWENFFFEQLFPVVARTWLGSKSVCFFWAQNLGFGSKNPFFAIQPKFSAQALRARALRGRAG